MSFSERSSDSEWKDSKKKAERVIKRESNGDSSSSKQKYAQRFVDKWLNLFRPWLARDELDPNKPFCRACQTRLDCNRCHLQRHERTTKHARNLQVLISKGEGAARQNLSLRKERSKMRSQRMQSAQSMPDGSDHAMDTTEEFIEEDYGDTQQDFHFVQAEAVPEYAEELKEEFCETRLDHEGRTIVEAIPAAATTSGGAATDEATMLINKTKKNHINKERMKLLMQIQNDKNDLLESFKELMGTSLPAANAKERTDLDIFFESVSTSIKKLSPKLISESKMRIAQVVCEMELRALDEHCALTNNGAVNVAPDAEVVNESYIINQPGAIAIQSVRPSRGQETEEVLQTYEAFS